MEVTLGTVGWYALIGYLVVSGVQVYNLLVPKGCAHPAHWDCLSPAIQPDEKLHVRIYGHTSKRHPPPTAELILDRPDVDPTLGFEV